MSAISGHLIRAFNWRWMFISEGLPTVVWAFLWWFLACDRPAEAAWLSAAEKTELARRLAGEQSGLPAMRNLREALWSRTVVVLSLHFFF